MTEYKLSRENLKKDMMVTGISLLLLLAQVCYVFTTFKASSGLKETSVVLKTSNAQKSEESIACSFHDQKLASCLSLAQRRRGY
jgi:hypothetical protein